MTTIQLRNYLLENTTLLMLENSHKYPTVSIEECLQIVVRNSDCWRYFSLLVMQNEVDSCLKILSLDEEKIIWKL